MPKQLQNEKSLPIFNKININFTYIRHQGVFNSFILHFCIELIIWKLTMNKIKSNNKYNVCLLVHVNLNVFLNEYFYARLKINVIQITNLFYRNT